jgi:hypothetical protein
MINTSSKCKEVDDMPKAKSSNDIWDEIIDSLVLETEPPTKYIKDAVIVTKNGSSYRLSANDFADLCAREKMIPPEQSEIQHCSVSIDFTRIKRDVNKWSMSLIENVEQMFPTVDLGAKSSKKKKPTIKKITKKTTTARKRKVD